MLTAVLRLFGRQMKEFIREIITYANRISSYDLKVVIAQLLLIGLVVHLVMRFLRGTRGARLVKGVMVVMATVYMVIRVLPKDPEWRRVEFLYGQFLLFALFAVVVALQPELRRALIHIGQARVFRSMRSEIEAILDALVDSSAYFARNKIGSLIAVERTVELGALMASGTLLDAELSANLLKTIFYPGSALHDMGVIVREARIVSAGCQFPLAESEEIDPSLGSRHRAALGLSQETDAVVLVISEETGRISLACEGQLYIGLEQENLREMLRQLLAPSRKMRRAGRAAKAQE